MIISDHRPRHTCAEWCHKDLLLETSLTVSPWSYCRLLQDATGFISFLFQSAGFVADAATKIGARVLPQGLAAGVGFQDRTAPGRSGSQGFNTVALALCWYRVVKISAWSISSISVLTTLGKNQTWKPKFATDWTSSSPQIPAKKGAPAASSRSPWGRGSEMLANCLSHGFMASMDIYGCMVTQI